MTMTVLGAILDDEKAMNYLTIFSLALVLYDHILTFGAEIDYFWSGSWCLSRVLFLLGRYFPPIALLLSIVSTFGSWTAMVRVTLLTTYFATIVLEAIVVLRVWYILSLRRIARIFVVISFLVIVAVTARELASIYPSFQRIVFFPTACIPPRATSFWKLYMPDLALQTIVFGGTLLPAVRVWRGRQRSQLLKRIVRDGGLFYVAVFAVTAYTAIGSFQTNNMTVTWAAAYSNLFLAVTCVSVSRLMLSIRSLAAQLSLSMDLDTLFSTAELSRIRWKRGEHDRELIVDIDTVEGIELEGSDGRLTGPSGPAIHMSMVGRYYTAADLDMGGFS